MILNDNRTDLHWGTKSEINFLRGLGQWSTSVNNRKQLLRKYLKSMKKRYYWGNIDVEAVEKEVLRLLNGGKGTFLKNGGWE